MIEIHTHNVDSAMIDIIDVEKIRIKKAFETDTPQTCYREIQFIDAQCRVLTVQLYAKKIENLDIREE